MINKLKKLKEKYDHWVYYHSEDFKDTFAKWWIRFVLTAFILLTIFILGSFLVFAPALAMCVIGLFIILVTSIWAMDRNY